MPPPYAAHSSCRLPRGRRQLLWAAYAVVYPQPHSKIKDKKKLLWIRKK